MEDGVVSELSELGERASHQSASSVLDLFAQAAQVPFDRLTAARLLREATRAIPGDDAIAWGRRLVEVGESLDLRIRTVESTLADVLLFPQQGIPVATCRDAGSGQLTWLLITAVRGAQVQVVETTDLDGARWISQKALGKLLGIQGSAAVVRWVIGQAALACGKAAGQHEEGRLRTPSPLTRLLQLVRPERSDLGALIVFSAVVGVLALASPIAIEALVNTVAFGQYLQPVIVLALILFTFLGFAAAIRGLITYVVEIIQRRLFVRVVEDLAYRLPRVETAALDGKYGPELANRFFDIVTVQKVVAALLVDGLAIVLQTGIGMIVLAFYHPFLLGFDVVLLTMIGIALFGLGRGAVKSAIKESKMKYAMAAWLQELTRSPTAFKFHGGTQLAIDRADKLAVDYLDARKKHFRIVLRQVLFALGLQAVAATILLGLGGWLVLQGELTLGQLVAAELIVMTIVGSFAKMGKHMENFYDLLASVDKLGTLFDLPVESHNKLFHLRDGLAATVRAEQVSYSFGEHAVLDGLSLTIEPGERVAIVGPPGSGKSTLMELLSGLRAPDGGHIELDEIDLRELRPDSLREQVSLARGVEVFAGTIAENVHLHRPQISARDIRDALNGVGLRESILRLPDGLQTVLQPDGRPLSSSQSQRLMLARALAGQPRLLLIDATLDALPADVLQPMLAQLFGGNRSTTVLVVTARREILAHCDRVISLPPPTADDSSARGSTQS